MSGAKVRNSEEYYINIYVFMDVEENFRRRSAAKAWMLMYWQAHLIPRNALNSYFLLTFAKNKFNESKSNIH